jgi:hypothetical protein
MITFVARNNILSMQNCHCCPFHEGCLFQSLLVIGALLLCHWWRLLAKQISYNSERAASRGKEIQKKEKDLVEHASFIFEKIIGSVAV